MPVVAIYSESGHFGMLPSSVIATQADAAQGAPT
jgi:hypothetical protein